MNYDSHVWLWMHEELHRMAPGRHASNRGTAFVVENMLHTSWRDQLRACINHARDRANLPTHLGVRSLPGVGPSFPTRRSWDMASQAFNEHTAGYDVRPLLVLDELDEWPHRIPPPVFTKRPS